MRRRWILGVGVALLAATALGAAEIAPVRMSESDKDALALAAKIDELIGAKWKEKGIKPAELSDDGEFLRRVYLDLVGHVPQLLETGNFLDKRWEDKRWQLVKTLVQSDRFSTHFAAVWRAILLGQANNQQNQAYFTPFFEQFLKQRIKDGTGYDKMVREIITAQPQGGFGASAFYQAYENKPETVAAATSRLFLGVKIECAQCHKHPFAKWSQTQFWEFATFFSGLQTGQMSGKPAPLCIPGTDTKVDAKFLDGKEPEWKNNVDRRVLLADWITSADNPWFAKEAVNRLWEYFFGIGLIEPVDDINPDNPASHPELLDELARQFVEHKFDMTYLIRAIVMSKTYQLTSAASDASQDDPRMFARMPLRGMSAEQLYDSLVVATTDRVPDPVNAPNNFGGTPLTPRQDFLSRFPNQDRRTETKTSILQALYFMNGKKTTEATTLKDSPNLKAVAEIENAPITIWVPVPKNFRVEDVAVGSFRPPLASPAEYAKRIGYVYKMVLSRRPTPAEVEKLTKYLESGGPTGDRKKAVTDVFWALINSSEFYFNR
jgi:hypothetical protein